MEKYKKNSIIFSLLTLLLLSFYFFPRSLAYASNFDINKINSSCKAYYLVDYASGEILLKNNENERLKIASMVKIMSSLLVLEEIQNGRLSFDEEITISENAASMGGSEIFLDKGSKHKVSDLLKSVLVASANDSTVALSERVAGSEQSFVVIMNEKAKKLGMNDTLFENATGLPTENQYSTAKDVSVMFRELLKHKEVYDFGKIWTEDYMHPSGRATTMTNTNKLIRYYNGCDMGKTGYTSEAKHCLSATANRNGMRIVAVVIGANSSKERFYDASSLLNYAFENYENKVVVNKGTVIGNANVKGGKQNTVDLVVNDDIRIFAKKGKKPEFTTKILNTNIKSPIKKGDKVAKLEVSSKYGKSYYDLVTSASVDKASYIDSIENIFVNW